MRMSKKVERALRASIAHWKRMRKDPLGKDKPFGAQCDLCSECYDFDEAEREDEYGCKTCPLARAGHCCNLDGSPFSIAKPAWYEVLEYPEDEQARETFNSAADAMIAAMVKLLPKRRKAKAK